MTIRTNTTNVKASMRADDRKTVTGFTPVDQSPEISFTVAPSTTTYNRVLIQFGTLNANTNTTINLASFTSSLGESVTATKLAGYEFKAVPTVTTSLGGQFVVSPGATNPATLFMTGTNPAFSAPVNTNGCCLFVMSGSHEVVNTTVKNVLLTNSGTNAIDFTAYALLGD